MSMRRPAGGRRIATGMLRVDAARAISKLRDYQLSEPTAWVLEGIRAAVASGATSVALHGDSNDVWLSWHGEAWPSESLPTLLDELVSPSSAQHGQKFRLLATAVNSALGLDPSYIDVYRIDREKAEKVRYVVSLLEELDDATELSRPTLEEVAIPSRANGACMFVHFRRRFGVAPLRNLLRGEPPEMPIAREACADLPIPIVIGDTEFGAHLNPCDVLRENIGQDIDGFLALMDPSYAHASKFAQMHVAEHGVRIASYGLDLQDETLLAPVPIRLFINAARMPTNASRSEIRRNSYPIDAAEQRIPALFEALCEKAVRALALEASTEPSKRAALRESTLALLAASIAGSNWAERARSLDGPLGSLAELKLLRNALGDERSLTAGWDTATRHTGKQPLDAELRPRFTRTLWVPDGDASKVISPHKVDPSRLRLELRAARRELKARERFEAHATREPILERVPKYWVRSALDAAVANSCAPVALGGFAGEILLCPRQDRGTITVLVDGREIEDVEFETTLPFHAIVAGPRISPSPEYCSVLRDAHYYDMESHVKRAAIRCVEALCLEAVVQDGNENYSQLLATSREEMRAIVRGAVESTLRLGLNVSDTSPLASYAVWKLTDGTWASLRDLREHNAVGCASSSQNLNAPSGRIIVICANATERVSLRSLLELTTAVVHYDSNRPSSSGDSAIEFPRSTSHMVASVAALTIHEDDCSGTIAWGLPKAGMRVYHRGRHLQSFDWFASVPNATICVDGDSVIPTPNWDGVHDHGGLEIRDFSSWEVMLVRAYAMALVGRAPSELFTKQTTPRSLNVGAGKMFVDAILRAEDTAELLGIAYEALRAAPLFETLGGGLVSADDLARAFPYFIDYVESAPLKPFEDGEWKPLLASLSVATFAAQLADRDVHEVSAQLKRRRIEQARQAKIAQHQRKPKLTQQSCVEGSPVHVEFRTEFASGLVGMGPATSSLMDLAVLVEGRHFTQAQADSAFPLVAAVELEVSQVDDSFEQVSTMALAEVSRGVYACVPLLMEAALKANGAALLENDRTVLNFLRLWLASSSLALADLERVCNLIHFFDQRGQQLSFRDASRTGSLAISTYAAEPWLEAERSDPQNDLDTPVVVLSETIAPALKPILGKLCGVGYVRDVSASMRQLQIERRIARGLLLAPTVAVDSALKRTLTDLIATESIGEIGYYAGSNSQVLICDQGVERARIEVDVHPAVIVAIEDSTLAVAQSDDDGGERHLLTREQVAFLLPELKLEDRVRNLSNELARSVLATGDKLPEWLRMRFTRAMCSGHMDPREIPGLATGVLFNTIRGVRVAWEHLCTQAERFGDVWYVPSETTSTPLDPLRIALALQAEEVPTKFSDHLLFVSAEAELALDEQTRHSMAQPAIESLALNDEQSVSAVTCVELAEEGLRGIVAPLFPEAAGLRGVHAHKEMKRIGQGVDPCGWPTLAIVDDANLQPNRTWSEPFDDDAWQRVSKAIQDASDAALTNAMPPPLGVVTSHWVGRRVGRRLAKRQVASLRWLLVRGRVWLTRDTEGGAITIRQALGETICHPHHLALPLPVHGELLMCGASDLSAAQVQEAVEDILDYVYPQLLHQVSRLKYVDDDTRAAHLALGLATGHADLSKVMAHKFPCFAPGPIDAVEMLELTTGDSPVAMVESQVMVGLPEGRVFLRDESELSRVLLRLLKGRLFDIESPEHTSVEIEFADAPEDVVAAPQSTPHVFDRLSVDLHRRLGLIDLQSVLQGVTIALKRKAPIMVFEDGYVVLSGENEQLRSLEASRFPGDVTYESCLDVLVAHALTLLNHAHTHITDAAERRGLVTLMNLER